MGTTKIVYVQSEPKISAVIRHRINVVRHKIIDTDLATLLKLSNNRLCEKTNGTGYDRGDQGCA